MKRWTKFKYRRLFNKIYKEKKVIIHFIGTYELLMIQKKSLSLGNYKRKVLKKDEMSDFKDSEEVEKLVDIKIQQFWKNLTFSPSIYGADV